jgi:hypothetical protein
MTLLADYACPLPYGQYVVKVICLNRKWFVRISMALLIKRMFYSLTKVNKQPNLVRMNSLMNFVVMAVVLVHNAFTFTHSVA